MMELSVSMSLVVADLEVLCGGGGRREAGGRLPAGVSLLPRAAQVRLHDTLQSNILQHRNIFSCSERFSEIFSPVALLEISLLDSAMRPDVISNCLKARNHFDKVQPSVSQSVSQ